MRRASATLLASAACLGVALDAHSAAAPPVASWGSLPEGHVGSVPIESKAPSRLGGGEHVPGVFVGRAPASQRAQWRKYSQPAWVTLFATAEEAKQFGQDGMNKPVRDELCVTTGDRTRGIATFGDEESNEPTEWPSFFEARPSIMGRPLNPQANVYGGVTAVHVEKLVRGEPGKASLEMTDAWIDPLTGGMRLIRRSTMPLVRVATGPTGIEVLAARDTDRVELVVTAATPPGGLDPQTTAVARQFTRMNALFGPFQFAQSDCGHMRVALRTSDEKGPVTAVVQTTALLPPLEKVEPEKDGASVSFQGIRAIRRRPVNVGLSLTQTSGDKEPIVSVSVGWAGREAKQ